MCPIGKSVYCMCVCLHDVHVLMHSVCMHVHMRVYVCVHIRVQTSLSLLYNSKTQTHTAHLRISTTTCTQPHTHAHTANTDPIGSYITKRARKPYTCVAKPIEHAYIPRLQLTRKQLSPPTAPGSMGTLLTNLYSQRTQHLESLTWLCSLLCTLP